MAIAYAKSRFIRIAPRKARLAAGLIREMPVGEAVLQLTHSSLKAGQLLLKTLKSAIANGENNENMDRDNMIVSEVRVDEGPRMKRSRSKNRGGRHLVLKRTSHLTVVVSQV
ncbi:MAG: 50S ribosomal protein L22 [Chlamydiia bacterium]|nr:50S ribosomal protein L22 [Chlamydiia bacterium]